MLEVKLFGKEPEVVLGFFRNNDNQMTVNCKGDGVELLSALTMIITAMKQKFPKNMVYKAIKIAEEAPFEGMIIDVEAIKKQSGK